MTLLVVMVFLGLASAFASEQPAREGESSLLQQYADSTKDIILQGLRFVGVRYVYGGNNEISGLDCSGFVRLVFQKSVGVLLPRTSQEMSNEGVAISLNELKPGDLVFFKTLRRGISHVGIYLGDNYFLHAPRTGSEVKVESMASGYYADRLVSARRVLEAK